MTAQRNAADLSVRTCRDCEGATSLEELAAYLFAAVHDLGLTFVACGAHPGANALPEGAFLFHNYPAEWTARFQTQGYHRIDPVMRRAETTKAPFSWDDEAFLDGLAARQKRLLAEAREFRIAGGYTVPLRHDYYLPASISVISETGDIDPWTKIAVGMVGVFVHHRASLLAQAQVAVGPNEKLTDRERECLDLKAHGASDGEIAARLGISVSTVCRHIEQAKLRLNARSREHAVWRGVETRQIVS